MSDIIKTVSIVQGSILAPGVLPASKMEVTIRQLQATYWQPGMWHVQRSPFTPWSSAGIVGGWRRWFVRRLAPVRVVHDSLGQVTRPVRRTELLVPSALD